MKRNLSICLIIAGNILANMPTLSAQMVSSRKNSNINSSSSSLITGPVSHWAGGTTPSCIYPNFHTDSILVTVPAGINITFFTIDYAYVTSTLISHEIPISDGIFYLSTTCAQTDTLSCLTGDTAGVCYLIPDEDFHSLLIPCITPSCNPQSFWLYAHLARRYAGIGCDTSSVWYSDFYDTNYQYHFSAYVAGTPSIVFSKATTNDTGPCNGTAKVTPSGGISPYTYLWSPGNQTSDSIGGLCYGTYYCSVTDNKGCMDTVIVPVSKPTGINTINNASKISIYPDPNKGSFIISGVMRGQTIELYNDLGQKLKSIITDNTDMYFDISMQANGVYLIRILNKDGSLVTQKKIVKE